MPNTKIHTNIEWIYYIYLVFFLYTYICIYIYIICVFSSDVMLYVNQDESGLYAPLFISWDHSVSCPCTNNPRYWCIHQWYIGSSNNDDMSGTRHLVVLVIVTRCIERAASLLVWGRSCSSCIHLSCQALVWLLIWCVFRPSAFITVHYVHYNVTLES